MEPLSTTRWVSTWLSMYPAPEDSTEPQKIAYKACGLLVFLGPASFAMATLAFFLKYLSIDLESSLYALFQVLAFTSITYSFVVAFILRKKILLIFDQLSRIYDERKKIIFRMKVNKTVWSMDLLFLRFGIHNFPFINCFQLLIFYLLFVPLVIFR